MSPPRDPAPITEPEIIGFTFCTEVAVTAHPEFVRLTGFDEVPIAGYDGPEMRIVSRVVLSREASLKLLHDLRLLLGVHER